MPCTIEWIDSQKSRPGSGKSLVRRCSLLQCYNYNKTETILNNQKLYFGLINIDGENAGFVWVRESAFFGKIIHNFSMDHGPVWFDGFGEPAHIQAFFKELNRLFPNRVGRNRRIMPAIEDSQDGQARQWLEALGYQCINPHGHETFWIDLTKDLPTLRSMMKSNWRNKLSQAERAGLTLEWDEEGRFFPWLLKIYQLDKAQRGYNGPSTAVLSALAKNFTPDGHMLIGRALLDKRPLAAILLFRHGLAATYQIGWTSEDGRRHRAHHLLLWDAVQILKEKGVYDFDLGGVNETSAKSVKDFKAGMGGTFVRYPGIFR
ncbi:MAG: GNAT family N-acetyltransferase [Alphaproteobacteria bacterium]